MPGPAAQLDPSDPPQDAPADALLQFIADLRAGYERLRSSDLAGAENAATLDHRVQTLLLADAALRYSDPPLLTPSRGGRYTLDQEPARARAGAAGRAAGRPPQVAVLGPTQTGKSTVANLILGRTLAEISPLAGFTVHPHGFIIAEQDAAPDEPRGGLFDASDRSPAVARELSSPVETRWAAGLFPGWRRLEPEQLRRTQYDAFSLVASAAGERERAGDAVRRPIVVWDTPDFDSLAARRYVRGVLETAALADVYVLVLSKEKYSDLSVWHFLELVEPLARPLILVLNKVTPDAEAALLRSLRERLAQRGPAWGDVPIVPLQYDPQITDPQSAPGRAAGARLRALLDEHLPSAEQAGRRAAGARALLRRHWDAWLAPARAEQAARAAWRERVAAAGAQFMDAYERDYLDHPQRYDSLRRAAVELLNLLEIPRVGGAIARVRRVLTFPARRLLGGAQAWWAQRQRGGRALHSLGAEATVLLDALDTLLAGLERDVVRRCAPPGAGVTVWLGLERRLEAGRVQLHQQFETAIRAHHARVTQEVQSAARALYEELQKHPARLAALRTARVTMDVGYMLLAVKTGGVGAMDVVWAPAAFALTSLVTEGMAGLEMARVRHQLRDRQRTAVREELVERTLVRDLAALADDPEARGVFGLDESDVTRAAEALASWAKGGDDA